MSSPVAVYGRLWRTVPQELGFLLLTLPVALVGFTVTITLFWTGIGLIPVLLVGILVIAATLLVGRGLGFVELLRLRWAGRRPIAPPVWDDSRGRGFFPLLWSVLSSGHYWMYLLHSMVVNVVLSLASFTIAVAWFGSAFSGLFSWIWRANDVTLRSGLAEQFVARSWFPGGSAGDILRSLLIAVLGLAFLVTLPFVTRGLVLLHDVVARGMLGAFASDGLRRRVGDLEASRGAAISAEGHSLRRLERDIHDGPQQRLVRLQMDLAAADRQLDRDPQKARTLIAEAMQQSKDALEELRALSRGFAPPMLLDRGLVAALESAALRSTVPVAVVDELPEGLELPQETERNAYFVASEALANAAKHADAASVVVRVSLRRVLDGDDTWLTVDVTDDGRGGAVAVAGHGLAGLDERLRGLGGMLEVTSPVGGPTSVTAHLPLAVSLGGSPAPSVSAPTAPSAPTL
jgi:signal transduction histidine kinase